MKSCNANHPSVQHDEPLCPVCRQMMEVASLTRHLEAGDREIRDFRLKLIKTEEALEQKDQSLALKDELLSMRAGTIAMLTEHIDKLEDRTK
jgi:hypothetical protein